MDQTDARIRAALTLPEPSSTASALLELFKEQPSSENVSWLADLFKSFTIENPTHILFLARSLVLLRDSADIPDINKNDYYGNPCQEKFKYSLSSYLYDLIYPAITKRPCEITPSNGCFIASLMSATLLKLDLCVSAMQVTIVANGIQLPASDYKRKIPPPEREVAAIGACLQLLIAGTIYNVSSQINHGREHVLPRLRALLTEDIIKYPNGRKLVEVSPNVLPRFPILMWLLSDDHSTRRERIHYRSLAS